MTRKSWEAFGLVVLIITMIACGSTWDWQMRHADLMKARAEGSCDNFEAHFGRFHT